MKSLIKSINAIDNMKDLNKVIDVIRNKQKSLRSDLVNSKKSELAVGMTVNISSKKGTLVGVITKINRTKAVVEINGDQFNCPISIMEAA